MHHRLPRLVPLIAVLLLMGCESQTQTDETSVALSTAGKEFVSGTKGVKLILSEDPATGSFNAPGVVPSAATIPLGYPGSGTGFYLPGVSAKPTGYFDLDGVTPVTKPSWISDVQLGVTGLPGSGNVCAKVGGPAAGPFDVGGFYRVSEMDCQPVATGDDLAVPVFIRVILNRDTAFIGTRENLMLQLEYRATGLRPNSDGSSSNPEENLDHLWKVFLGQTLLSSASLTPFSILIPPNYAHWCTTGSGNYDSSSCQPIAANRSAPPIVKQVLIPLSSNSKQSVIQIQRVTGRIHVNPGQVSSFCSTGNSPLCLGVVFHSLTLLRM